MQNINQPECDMGLYPQHESDSKKRYCRFQEQLDQMFREAKSLPTLTERIGALKDTMDIQLKLEDFLIKSREADHAKWYAWTPLVTGIVCAFIAAIISIIVALINNK